MKGRMKYLSYLILNSLLLYYYLGWNTKSPWSSR